MSALWPLGEGTVRDIHQRLCVARPRAYTTILTIMDRLAQKGIVTRQKVGRAYRYHPSLTREEARLKAVEKVVSGFFEGSAEALAAQLSAMGSPARAAASLAANPLAQPQQAASAAARTGTTDAIDCPSASDGESNPARLDETLN